MFEIRCGWKYLTHDLEVTREGSLGPQSRDCQANERIVLIFRSQSTHICCVNVRFLWPQSCTRGVGDIKRVEYYVLFNINPLITRTISQQASHKWDNASSSKAEQVETRRPGTQPRGRVQQNYENRQHESLTESDLL